MQYSAIPLRKQEIRNIAKGLREGLRTFNLRPFPIVQILEVGLRVVNDDFLLDIVPDNKLKDVYAKTYPEQHKIVLRQSVYDGACAGDGFYRMVLAHELGHYILHKKQTICYAKSASKERMPKEYSVEWQAEVFAYELMMPFDIVKRVRNGKELARQGGVSIGEANKRISFVKRELKKISNQERKKTKSYKKRFGHR